MILDLFRLEGKVAVVSAASRGIGAACARAFAEVGAKVAIGARTESALEGVARDVEKAGGEAALLAGDLSTREGMQALIDTALSHFGRIDVVVNNAGGSMPKPLMQTSERFFNEALAWNVTTAFNLTQLAVPHLLAAGGGSVINIASSAGLNPDRGFAAYGTAKAAMIQMTKNMATDLAPRIRVNAIAPGSIETEALGTVLTDPALREQMLDMTPLRRLGRESDIAAAAVLLASEAGSYITGQCISVDGGIRRSNLEMGIPDLE